MAETSIDWWMSEASSLQMPKREIADYVESQGFLVPKRFDTLDEALDVVRAGSEIVIRSEHRDEYDGPSGLMSSYRVGPETLNDGRRILQKFGELDIHEEIHLSHDRGAVSGSGSKGPGYLEVEDAVLGVILDVPTDLTIGRLKTMNGQRFPLKRYAELIRRPVADIMDETQYSFWQYIEGSNVTVTADSAIDDRYHVLANAPAKGAPRSHSWQITNENGHPTAGIEDDEMLTSEVTAKVIQAYEAIRNMPNFAPEHCPIMELQMDTEGRIWFLQYHRARDFQAARDALNPTDFPDNQGWQQVEAVRGAIDSPITLQTALWYPDYYGSRRSRYQLPEAEDASTDWHWDWALTEVLARRRLGYIAQSSRHNIYDGLAAAHDRRSKWFKPVVAVACNDRGLEKLIPETVKKEVQEAVFRGKILAKVVIDLAADGNNGYIRLNPDSEQPVYAL